MSDNQANPLKFTVAFDDTDCEGIVFFGNYFRLAHRALEAYLPTIGILWSDWFSNADFGAPLRHAEADFQKPLRAGETFLVTVKVEEIGTSSVHFGYFFQTTEGAPICSLSTSHVFVDRKTRIKASIPVSIREKLQNATK